MPNPDLFERVLRLLPLYQGVRGVTPVNYGLALVAGPPGRGMFFVIDNGGEFDVERINFDERRSAPTSWHGTPLTAGTVAYRVACFLRDETPDWNLKITLRTSARS